MTSEVLSRIRIDSVFVGEPDECWYSGWTHNSSGYASSLHRDVAEICIGDPTGLEVHHVCGNKPCVNPSHLLLVTITEHKELHLKNVCLNGHDLRDPKNIRWYRGNRWCRPCDALRRRRYRNESKS